jgi:hypothetical protein
VNDRKHFPTEMGGVTSPTGASSQRAGTVLSALPAARNEPQGTSRHGPRADCRHPTLSDGRTLRSRPVTSSSLREVAAPSRKVEDAVSATRTLLRMNSTISWRTWRASMGSRRFPYDPIDGIHRSLWNGSRMGIGSCRRPLWMMLMSSLHSKRTTWNRESVSTAAQALRSFFRHAERRGWCKAGIAAGIQRSQDL